MTTKKSKWKTTQVIQNVRLTKLTQNGSRPKPIKVEENQKKS